ncbi:hypothetical protein [Kribbella sindirgiensis]|nr:hypothetical protein [Kribbella sindirgiensis]
MDRKACGSTGKNLFKGPPARGTPRELAEPALVAPYSTVIRV